MPRSAFFHFRRQAGDTAQTIARGLAFRFEDLRSLFHSAAADVGAARAVSSAGGPVSASALLLKVEVPEERLVLTVNHRTHSGILGLANGVVDLVREQCCFLRLKGSKTP